MRAGSHGVVAALLAALRCRLRDRQHHRRTSRLTTGSTPVRTDHCIRVDRRPAARRVQPPGRQSLHRRRSRAISRSPRARVRRTIVCAAIWRRRSSSGRTHISWVWDVYDDDKLRALRITRRGSRRARAAPTRGLSPTMPDAAQDRAHQPWTSSRRSCAIPARAGRGRPPLRLSPEPEAPRKPQRRARSAAAPSAAERLALASAALSACANAR